MKKRNMKLIAALFIILFPVFLSAEPAPQKIIDLANTELLTLGEDSIIVAAVKAENAKQKTMEEIQEKDNTWKSTPGIVDSVEFDMFIFA